MLDTFTDFSDPQVRTFWLAAAAILAAAWHGNVTILAIVSIVALAVSLRQLRLPMPAR